MPDLPDTPPTVLGIAFSPRKGGNSELLLDECLKGAASAGATTEKIRVCELRISPCTASSPFSSRTLTTVSTRSAISIFTAG